MSNPPCPNCGHKPPDSDGVRSFSGLVETTLTDMSDQMRQLVDGVVESTGYSR